jgi:hypothetical protein
MGGSPMGPTECANSPNTLADAMPISFVPIRITIRPDLLFSSSSRVQQILFGCGRT